MLMMRMVIGVNVVSRVSDNWNESGEHEKNDCGDEVSGDWDVSGD